MPDRVEDGIDPATASLLSRAREGDDDALHALIETHIDWLAERVHRRLGGLARRNADTGDIVHDVLVRILTSQTPLRFTGQEQFRTYLEQVIVNTLRSTAGRHKRACRDVAREQAGWTESLFAAEDSLPVASVTRPEERAARAEDSEWLLAALDLLEGHDQDLVWLRARDGLPFRDIANRLGLSEDAARMRFSRILRKLYRNLKQLRSGRLTAVLEGRA
ncbi:MAG: sigma-70 family RNA polymerase sigma factor [Planctomycetes bacterium]|nr:sigma-70 family RNA polymerase sigma factor [Planctomycetota bacterium]